MPVSVSVSIPAPAPYTSASAAGAQPAPSSEPSQSQSSPKGTRSPPVADRPQANQSASPLGSPRQRAFSGSGSVGSAAMPPVSSPLVNADDSIRGGAKGVSLNEAIIAGRMQERGHAQQGQEEAEEEEQEPSEWD